jgi:hypothetical protein
MDPGGDQGLLNGSRQIIREGMRLRHARRQSPPGDEVGGGFRITLPEIQERGKRHFYKYK